jgi:hypothetical protein
MGLDLVSIDATRQETSLVFHVQIRSDPEGIVPQKRACFLFYLVLLLWIRLINWTRFFTSVF